jgi:type IX secretion system PorP/SprF family membrane protein
MKNFLAIVLAMVSTICYSQDSQFSQFYANQLYLNPAFAGTSHLAKVSLNYRNQWSQLPGAYITYSGSFDQYFQKAHGGLGIHFLNDVQSGGDMANTQISVVYAYHLQISHEWFASFGLQTSFVQSRIDWTGLIFPDMIDPLRGPVLNSGQSQPDAGAKKAMIDFSTGALIYSPTIFGGFSVSHLTEPGKNIYSDNRSRLPRKFTVHGGFNLTLNRFNEEPITFSPNILIQRQGTLSQINLGSYARRKNLAIGLWYRQNLGSMPDAFIASLGVMFSNFRFSYSYDLPISGLMAYSQMSHEVSMGILFNKIQKAKKFKAMPCPEF